MAKALQYTDAFGMTSAANTTEFWSIFGSSKKNTTEANIELIMRTAGTLSNFQVYLRANGISGGTTNITVRKNGTDTALAVAVAASATGIFEDNTNTVSIAAGDKVCFKTVPGGASGTIEPIFVVTLFTPTATGETVTKMAAMADYLNTNGISISSASTTRYYPINAYMTDSSSTPEVNFKCRQRLPGKFRSLAVRVRTNARATSTTIKFRKNGADGAQSVTIGAGATGWFEDTTNEDTVDLNDDVNYSVTTGTGANTIVLDSISCDYVNTSGYCQLVNATFEQNNIGDSININQTRQLGLAGGLFTETGVTYANLAWKAVAGAEFRFSNIGCSVHVDTVDTNSTLTLRVNNADTEVVTTILPNSPGSHTNAVNVHQVSIGDLVSLRLVVGSGSGSVNFGTTSIYANDLSTTTVLNAECDVSDMATDGEFTVNFTTADSIPRQTLWLSLSA